MKTERALAFNDYVIKIYFSHWGDDLRENKQNIRK